MSHLGTKLPNRDVSSTVAIAGRPDMAIVKALVLGKFILVLHHLAFDISRCPVPGWRVKHGARSASGKRAGANTLRAVARPL
jgi:hypothetical protein